MEKQRLTEGWKLEWKGGTLEARVPFSVYYDLLKHHEIDNPYDRDNENAVFPLAEKDYVYRLSFDAEEMLMGCEEIWLRFGCIDTLADIVLNGELLGSACNMHRVWEYRVKGILRRKDNLLEVCFHSPVRFMELQLKERGPIPCNTDTLDGFPYLRKAQYMSGWDWAPRLPDMGIYRPVELLGGGKARIREVLIRQRHEADRVELSFQVDMESLGDEEACACRIRIEAPDGRVVSAPNPPGRAVIEHPLLWWPRGYGSQPLYTVTVEAVADGRVEDCWERRIGLRTVGMRMEKDVWGECFAHEVNGVAIFAMGADYIPEESILPERSEEKTRRLLEKCAFANYNMLRVWGGAFYPEDYFYDLCDELGLLVWQDFMFACSTYSLTEEFEDNITQEIIENVRRIRHHACLGLWCGNNEVEGFIYDGFGETPRLRGDYTRMYSYVIPKLVKREDPDAFYWPSSPSSGGDFDDPQDETRGDAHYWQVWHGYKPFPEYRRHTFRYASEFGFESLPAYKTIEAFTLPEDRNLFSYVMEKHQRSENGYAKMMVYMAQYFPYAGDLPSLVYGSQLMQAQAMRYAVEHYRRNRGQCMGAVVWQLNDCWPAASWSSVDYYGRLKALHYFEKRFFEPVLLSCCEEGMLSQNPNLNARPYEMEKSIRLNVANETMDEQKMTVIYSLRDSVSEIIGEEHAQELTVPALSSVWLEKAEYPEADMREHHVCYSCYKGGEVVSEGSVLFTMPKFYRYADPGLEVSVEGEELTVRAKAYAAGVELLNEEENWILSDNYFDMERGEKRIRVLSGEAAQGMVRVRSIYDIGRR